MRTKLSRGKSRPLCDRLRRRQRELRAAIVKCLLRLAARINPPHHEAILFLTSDRNKLCELWAFAARRGWLAPGDKKGTA